jgi:glycosyltransferase involved in cell wall biosynthesis
MRIAHLTTVHDRRDPRIFGKQARSAAAAGYQVTLFVADGRGAVEQDGVRIIDLGVASFARLGRMLFAPWRALGALRRWRPDIVQIHDPELLPLALLLRALGERAVIVDVHEDNVAFARQKGYLPGWLRQLAAALVALLEGLAKRWLSVVIAEPAYAARFPNATLVSNYPALAAFDADPAAVPPELAALAAVEAPILIYTGNVTLERGALEHARLLRRLPQVHVALVGYTQLEVAEAARRAAGEGRDRLHLIGVGSYVDHAILRAAMRLPNVLAGLALFPRDPFYDEKELTKFFEYMAVGIPTLASDSPTWTRLLEREVACGVTVDPQDDAAVAAVVEGWLADPSRAQALGARGRAVVRQRFSWESAWGALEGVDQRLRAER